jgi:hypothetical protein
VADRASLSAQLDVGNLAVDWLHGYLDFVAAEWVVFASRKIRGRNFGFVPRTTIVIGNNLLIRFFGTGGLADHTSPVHKEKLRPNGSQKTTIL